MVGEHPDRFQLLVVQKVRFVDHDDGGAAPFGVFRGQRIGGALRDALVTIGDKDECHDCLPLGRLPSRER